MSETNNLLSPELKRPLDRAALGDDTAALNALVGFLNSPVMESTTQGEGSTGEMALGAPPISEVSQLEKLQSAASRAEVPSVPRPTTPLAPPSQEQQPINLRRFFLTGGLCVGKDYVAGLTGATVEGFSRPVYHLAEFFFGAPVVKSAPGMSAWLTTITQWGRAVVSEQYPYTPARAVFIAAIRSLGGAHLLDETLGVEWANYGRDENLWLSAALSRIDKTNSERVAITNVRYGHEFKALTEKGFSNWHVFCSPAARAERLAKRKIATNSPLLKDASEQLAAQLDAQVIREISRNKTGPKLRCVWNSPEAVPSPRIWTVSDFCKAAGVPGSQSFDVE